LLSGWDAPPRTFLALLIGLTFALCLLPDAKFVRMRRLALSGAWESTRVTVLAVALWSALVTLEYWAFGHWSVIVFGDEGGLSFPYFAHLARLPQWGRIRFDPAILGGSEITSLLANGGSLFSLEVWEFRIFGPELGFVLHKILNTFLATYGAFLVARNGVNAPYGVSILIAFSYSVSFLYVDSISLVHGLGYGLGPLGLYTLVYRYNRKNYYLGCGVFSLLIGASMSISHSNIAFYVALLCVAAYEGIAWRRQFLLGAAIVTLVIAFIWADVIYGMLSFVPLTPRGQASALFRDALGPRYLFDVMLNGYFYSANTLVVIAAGFIASRLQRSILRITALALSPWLLAVAYSIIPFRQIGLGSLETIDPVYLYFATSSVIVVVLAITARTLFTDDGIGDLKHGNFSSKFFISFIICLAFSSLVAAKHLHFLTMVGGSSRAIYHIENVEKLAASADPRFRALAGPDANSSEYFSDNVLLAYGLATAGGYFNLVDIWHNEYWKRAGVGSSRGYAGLPEGVFDCGQSYALKNIDLLRVGGIRYIVSRTPVEAPELTLLSGPADLVSEHCRSRGLHRIALAFQRNRPIRDAFIYELPSALPIAYFARAERHSRYLVNSDAFWDEVRRYAPDRVVSGLEIASDQKFDDQAKMLSMELKTNGYLIMTESEDVSMLVLNHPALPFWQVAIDSIPAQLVSVNGIHMAVKISAGRHLIAFSYCRWMPSDYLRKFWAVFKTNLRSCVPLSSTP
jgi:hypothetical protein